MQLLVIVLNKTECLDTILERFYDEKISGATILDSRGFAQSLSDHEELSFIASLRMLLDPDHKENKTIFMVVDEEKVKRVSKIVNEVTGGLDKPDTGIIFTLPISYVEGLSHVED